MKNNKKYVIFDLEATCYDRMEDIPEGFLNEIIEIGAVMVDENGTELSRFSKFAKPPLFPELSDFCKKLTTITQEDVDNADNLKDVIIEFDKWCDGSTMLSWGFYDKTQLGKDMIRNDLEHLLESSTIEDHFSLKHLYAKWNGLRKRGIGMGGALRREGLELDGTHHRGIDDAINITKIFRKYINKFKEEEL